jgi:hypothetical protein
MLGGTVDDLQVGRFKAQEDGLRLVPSMVGLLWAYR